MIHRLAVAATAFAMLVCAFASAQASVVITVNKSAQSLSVVVNGEPRYTWPVSTGRWGYSTPNGVYRPERLERKWYSRKYDWSPMPYSIFFHGGYAIHGSYEISRLGRPASHGCIRLHPKNAATLFRLVQANRGATRIVVTGERPARSNYAIERRRRYGDDDRPRRRNRYSDRRNFEDIFRDEPRYYGRDYTPPFWYR